MSSDQYGGFITAFCSLILTAVFPIFSKLQRVKSTGINPMVFNVYYEIGVILFCILATILVAITGNVSDMKFTYMGLISGILLGIGSWFVWLALTYMGIAHTSAFASGVASITGFLEGLAINRIPDVGLSIFALILIVAGTLGVGFNELLTRFLLKYLCCEKDDTIHLEWLTPEWLDNLDTMETSTERLFRFGSRSNQPQTEFTPLQTYDDDDDDDQLPIQDNTNVHATAMSPFKMRVTGILFASFAGLCFGSLAFPEEFTPDKTTEIYFLPSFGVGVALMVFINLVILSCKVRDNISWHFQVCFIPGLLSGIIWATGFLCILYAELLIDYSLAIPIRECSICLAVLIGIFFFKEITDRRAIIVTMICVFICLIGIFLIAMDVD